MTEQELSKKYLVFKLRDNANLFLSTKARYTWSGYSMAQILTVAQ